MAARRLTSSSVDWVEFAKKVPSAQRPAFNALKNKTDGYVRRIAALPEKAPAIDWNAYRSRIAVSGKHDAEDAAEGPAQGRIGPRSARRVPRNGIWHFRRSGERWDSLPNARSEGVPVYD